MLHWADLNAADVERVAQLLVREVCGATSIDGAGGDDAQDLRHDGADGLTIFEVKSFSKRLTTSQRRQIQGSLTRAVKLHRLYRWVLVIPLNPSPAELTWFDGLRARFPEVELEWFGLDWLDGKIAGREGLISYIEGAQSTLLRRARQHGLETAALTSGADLMRRMHDLQQLGDTITPYWTWRPGETPWGPAQVLTAQRTDAAEEDPIKITSYFAFPPDDPEAQATSARLQRVLRLGGDIEVPGEYVEQLEVAAASEATQRLLGESRQQVSSLRLISIPDNTGLPLQGSLVLQRQGGREGVSVPFAFTERVGGTEGKTLTGSDPSGVLEGRLELAGGAQPSGKLELNLGPLAGLHPHDVLPAVRLMAACQPGDTLQFRVGPVCFSTFTADAAASEGTLEAFRLVAALEVLQTYLSALIPVPVEPLEDEDAHLLMAMAAALTGTSAILPYTGLSLALRPDGIESFLASMPTGPGGLYGAPNSVEVTLDGTTHEVAGLAFWAPSVELTNRHELEALVGDTDAAVASFTCTDGNNVRLIRAVEDPGPAFKPLGVLQTSIDTP